MVITNFNYDGKMQATSVKVKLKGGKSAIHVTLTLTVLFIMTNYLKASME